MVPYDIVEDEWNVDWLRTYYKVPKHIPNEQVDRYVEILQAETLKDVARELQEKIDNVHP